MLPSWGKPEAVIEWKDEESGLVHIAKEPTLGEWEWKAEESRLVHFVKEPTLAMETE